MSATVAAEARTLRQLPRGVHDTAVPAPDHRAPTEALTSSSHTGRSLGGKKGSAVLRAKPAAERAAMFQKGWAKRRAKAAAAQLAELESHSGAS
jgi:hypothetical protein